MELILPEKKFEEMKNILLLLSLVFFNRVNAQLCFSPAANYTIGVNTYPLRIVNADFNSDGNVDLVIGNQGSGNLSILLGTGSGSFGSATNFATNIYPVSITGADFNIDGKADLAVCQNGSFNVCILLGTGTGSFGSITNFTVVTTPNSITSDDFNGDGKPDLVVTLGAGADSIAILLGAGTGSFGGASYFAVDTLPNSVVMRILMGMEKKIWLHLTLFQMIYQYCLEQAQEILV